MVDSASQNSLSLNFVYDKQNKRYPKLNIVNEIGYAFDLSISNVPGNPMYDMPVDVMLTISEVGFALYVNGVKVKDIPEVVVDDVVPIIGMVRWSAEAFGGQVTAASVTGGKKTNHFFAHDQN